MSPTILTIYTLIWPLIVAGVLFVLVSAFWKEWRKGRSKGRSLI
ncbi:putative transporter small subunit [Paracoccus albus]|nr:putative transporter small subunit [Paracoccus albus]WBU59643.1 putative transporter small subunit [Paracoccus albus]